MITDYAPTWQSRDPLSGSAHRSLILSAECLPPRAIYASCISAGVQWFDWMYFLGNSEFKLSVDPGKISVQQCHSDSRPVTVWAAEVPSPAVATRKPRCDTIQAAIKRRYDAHQKTFAQEILENDNEEDDQLFSVLADHINAPQWMTPVTDKFPTSIHRSSSPLSSISSGSRSSYSAHSRSSSFSSNASSNGYSMESSSSSSTIASQSRRNKARQSRVYIDTTKNEVCILFPSCSPQYLTYVPSGDSL